MGGGAGSYHVGSSKGDWPTIQSKWSLVLVRKRVIRRTTIVRKTENRWFENGGTSPSGSFLPDLRAVDKTTF